MSSPAQLSEQALPSDDEDDCEVLVGSALMKVVGIRYYTGVLHKGEFAFLNREPHNPYDSNAIAVKNHVSSQVGHIARDMAACLAPIMDDQRAIAPRIEAEVLRPAASSVSIKVSFYSTPSLLQRTAKRLRRHGIDVMSPQAFGDLITKEAGEGVRPSGGREREGEKGRKGGAVVSKNDGSAMQLSSQKALEDLFDRLSSEDQPIDIAPCRASLSGKLSTDLLKHQEEGVAWMLNMERSTNRLPFWKELTEKGQRVFFNEITNTSYTKDPGPPRGGILADDMGLGKTIQILALIIANPAGDGNNSGGVIDLTSDGVEPSLAATGGGGGGGGAQKRNKKEAGCHGVISGVRCAARGTTLVVCPTSVMPNWLEQARIHVAESYGLRVFVHHGKSKETTDTLGQYDLVITSYRTLAAEADVAKGLQDGSNEGAKRKRDAQGGARTGGLLDVKWHRVVLDEAHTIRNRNTKVCKACLALTCKHAWAVTGTPVQNKADDVQSLFEFIRARPLHDASIFQQAIARPIRNGQAQGMSRLRVLMRTLCLRRGKSIIASALPTRNIEVHKVRLAGSHKDAYDALFESAAAGFESLLASGSEHVMRNYSSVLECILRMRQACDATELVPSERLQRARDIFAELSRKSKASGDCSSPLTFEEAQDLFKRLKGAISALAPDARGGGSVEVMQGEVDNGSFECSVCLDDLEEEQVRILRACKHVFCVSCLENIAATRHGGSIRCPMCRHAFAENDILHASALQQRLKLANSTGAGDSHSDPSAGSCKDKNSTPTAPKIAALIAALQEEWEQDPQQRAVVFSQFSSMLDLVGSALKEAFGPQICGRLDGSMTADKREATIKQFSGDATGSPRVLLVSLKAGGTGINLTRANLVFLLDLWWNFAVEEQAMDRVYRIGQHRPVKVVRYVCEKTIEERILQVQEAKMLLGQAALNQLSGEQLRQARLGDLKKIFER